MNDFRFIYIGWCHDSGHHDKIWTAFQLGEEYYAGWGRRGKSIRFKKHPSYGSLITVMHQKTRKDYQEINEEHLDKIVPHFKDDVARNLMFAKLANKVQ